MQNYTGSHSIISFSQKFLFMRFFSASSFRTLEIIGNPLDRKESTTTDLDIDTLPNIDWLYNIIHPLDPNDTHNVFSLAIPIEKTSEIHVNPV